MKRTMYSASLFALTALAAGFAARPAQAQTALQIVGALSNFDCYNTTPSDCEGFEIEIEGIHKEQVAHTWNYSAYGAPTVTDGGTAALPSAIIRYHSNSAVVHTGGVTHFGVTLTYYTKPGTISRRWLPASTINVPNPAPAPYILPAHQAQLTVNNGVESVHDTITNDTPDGVTILWVLPFGNKVHGRGVSLEELMPTNAIVANAVPMGSGSNHLTPSRLDPGMTWMSDDPAGADDTASGILWYEVYKDVVTTGSGNGGKVTHTPGALIGRVMDATITNFGNAVPGSILLSDTAVYGTQDVIGKVTIQGAPTPGGTVITLTSDNPAATLPATVTVPDNQVSALFTIHTTAVGALTTVNISATTGGGIRSARFNIKSPDLYLLFTALQQTGGGDTVSGTVFLTSPAPANGAIVDLTSSSFAATVPGTVTVPAGSASVNFTITTQPVTTPINVTLSANFNGGTKTAILRVVPNVVTVSGTITLEGLAASAPNQNVTFTFRPTNGGASFDRTAAIGAGKTFSFLDITPGTYTLHVKGAKYLAANLPVNAANSSVSGLSATLSAGDANDDNFCDATDFGQFVSAYNSSASVPGSGYDPACDFNSDGSVDATDFGLLVGNYDTVGAP